MPIDVIDLFAGPGGLGEGFASLNRGRDFRIVVSAEMESSAHKTLTLRAFFAMLCATATNVPWMRTTITAIGMSLFTRHWLALCCGARQNVKRSK